MRKENIRNAFNSPMRPFVLATTSIGQEGLDFHNYCRVIMHWNLPSNPIDVGRILRRFYYAGHDVCIYPCKFYGWYGRYILPTVRSDNGHRYRFLRIERFDVESGIGVPFS